MILKVSNLTSFLKAQFQLKDLNSLKCFPELEIVRSAKGISACRNKYAIEILQDCGLLVVKPAKFPMEPNVKFFTYRRCFT